MRSAGRPPRDVLLLDPELLHHGHGRKQLLDLAGELRVRAAYWAIEGRSPLLHRAANSSASGSSGSRRSGDSIMMGCLPSDVRIGEAMMVAFRSAKVAVSHASLPLSLLSRSERRRSLPTRPLRPTSRAGAASAPGCSACSPRTCRCPSVQATSLLLSPSRWRSTSTSRSAGPRPSSAAFSSASDSSRTADLAGRGEAVGQLGHQAGRALAGRSRSERPTPRG